MKALLLLLCVLCFGVSAQSPSPTPTPQGQATIIVYRNFYHTTFGKYVPTITVNGEKLANLDEGRYFVAHVPDGFLSVASGKKKANRVDIEAKAGETYHLRVRAHPGVLFPRFELFRVNESEFKADFEKLRYVTAKDIKSERVEKGPK